MSTFDIILKQCEVQAEKLCSIEIDEKYLNEIDIFNNYFSQLKQVIESEKENQAKDKVKKLADLLQTFIKRIRPKKISKSASKYISELEKEDYEVIDKIFGDKEDK